jgi:N-methylhydantoinase A
MELDLEGARRAIKEHIADKLQMSTEEAAWGIHQVVNENMANAARVHLLERGTDPQQFPVFAFGGAGPVHGFRIAQALGSPALIAPLGAGVMSSVGFLTAPLAFDFVRSWRAPLAQLDWVRANALLAEMTAEGRALLELSGVAAHEISLNREADMRYVGQGHEIRVPLAAGTLNEAGVPALLTSFEEMYRQLYGRLGPPVSVEIINWRVALSGPKPTVRLQMERAAQSAADPRKGTRRAYFHDLGGFAETPVYDRYRLTPGASLAGPAIVEERESTTIVGPGGECRIDEQWNLIVQLR